MDFASLMKAEINKKAKVLETKNLITDNKKSFKRAELYKRGYNGVKFVSEGCQAKRAKDSGNVVHDVDKDLVPMQVNVADDEIAKEILATDNTVARKVKGVDKAGKLDENISNFMVKKRLRERHEPIKLFGEDDETTYIRLRKFELQVLGNLRFADSWLRNDFSSVRKRQKKEEIDALLKREYAKYEKGGEKSVLDDGDRANVDHNKEFKYNIKLFDIEEEVRKLLPWKIEDWDDKMVDAYNYFVPFAQKLDKGTRQIEMDLMLWTFRFLQLSWGIELNEKRTLEQKKSIKGKAQTNVYLQTEEALRPFFKMLRDHNLQHNIALWMSEMIRCVLLERNYVKATDAYMNLALGNSPWPLGITHTQIHIRPGHEKIKAKNIWHVMNDETKRRYIHASKRLVTIAQRVWPHDPKKCIGFSMSRPDYDLLAASSVDMVGAPVISDLKGATEDNDW